MIHCSRKLTPATTLVTAPFNNTQTQNSSNDLRVLLSSITIIQTTDCKNTETNKGDQNPPIKHCLKVVF